MTLDEFLRGLSQVFLLVVTTSTLLNWARYRDRTRRDIALVFVTLTANFIVEDLQILFGVEFPWLIRLGPLVVASHPYFLLRLAQYFSPIRKAVQHAALAGLLISWGVLFFFSEPATLAAAVFVFGYFAIVEVYAASILVRGALTIPGITGKRLQLVSIGSGILAFLFIVAIVLSIFIESGNAPPTLESDFTSFLQVFLVVSGLAFYFGFSPPRWLKRFWQLSELKLFLDRKFRGPSYERSIALEELSTAALRTVGGATAVIALCDADERHLRIELPGEPPLQTGDLEDRPVGDVIGKAWRERKAYAAQIPKEVGEDILRWAEPFNARALLIVPIQGAVHAWGLLIVALRYDPLFPQDDLDLLVLLAEQSAAQLDYVALNQELLQTNKTLEAANRELEAFSYSVSHDLRSPLRSIDGFSQIVLEDHSDQLSAEGRDHLLRIRAAAQRMGQLIDDLLNLSRVMRAAFQPQLVDLSEMAESIAGTLREENPERDVVFSVTANLMANVDLKLMHIVLDNLLRNAWKFTSKQERAVIEFGLRNQDDRQMFFVRDNGAGFDMNYVNKLFRVFQRLHSVSEYPGTGVGLATVQRIIKLHGGDVWAEAEVGKGATFYFTL